MIDPFCDLIYSIPSSGVMAMPLQSRQRHRWIMLEVMPLMGWSLYIPIHPSWDNQCHT